MSLVDFQRRVYFWIIGLMAFWVRWCVRVLPYLEVSFGHLAGFWRFKSWVLGFLMEIYLFETWLLDWVVGWRVTSKGKVSGKKIS